MNGRANPFKEMTQASPWTQDTMRQASGPPNILTLHARSFFFTDLFTWISISTSCLGCCVNLQSVNTLDRTDKVKHKQAVALGLKKNDQKEQFDSKWLTHVSR